MQRSLSDIWRQVCEPCTSGDYNYVPIVQHISAYKQGDCVELKAQVTRNNTRMYRSIACGNFLAFVGAFNKLQQELTKFIESNGVEMPPKNEEYEKRELAMIKNYLSKKRAEYAEENAAKKQALEERVNKTIGKVRPMVQYVLNRYKPVVDQFAYANVYGRPVEKIFY